MSNKVANLIAIELGVLIALMAWLAFSNLRSVQTQALAPAPNRMVDSFATVAPLRQTRRPGPVDYRADLGPEPQLDEAPPQIAPEYDQTIPEETYTDSNLDSADIAATGPVYASAEPEPLFASPDCLFAPGDRFVVYPQSTAFVVFSDSRTFARRPRSRVPQNNVRPTVMHRRPPVPPRSHGGGRGLTPLQKPQPQTPRPKLKPRPRQNP